MNSLNFPPPLAEEGQGGGVSVGWESGSAAD